MAGVVVNSLACTVAVLSFVDVTLRPAQRTRYWDAARARLFEAEHCRNGNFAAFVASSLISAADRVRSRERVILPAIVAAYLAVVGIAVATWPSVVLDLPWDNRSMRGAGIIGLTAAGVQLVAVLALARALRRISEGATGWRVVGMVSAGLGAGFVLSAVACACIADPLADSETPRRADEILAKPLKVEVLLDCYAERARTHDPAPCPAPPPSAPKPGASALVAWIALPFTSSILFGAYAIAVFTIAALRWLYTWWFRLERAYLARISDMEREEAAKSFTPSKLAISFLMILTALASLLEPTPCPEERAPARAPAHGARSEGETDQPEMPRFVTSRMARRSTRAV